MITFTKLRVVALISLVTLATQIYSGNVPLFSRSKQESPPVLGFANTNLEDLKNPFWVFNKIQRNELPPPPIINASGAVAIDLSNNQVFYEKNADRKLRIASLVKVMTAVVALENRDLQDIFIISQKAASLEPDSMGLYPGEKLTLKQLLQGMLLVSGNDAAEAITEGVSGGREGFVKLMNQKAFELGMKNTLYVNPSGLEGDGDHYSTALDLAILTRYALQKPIFREIVASKEVLIPDTVNEKENHKNFYLANSSPMVEYPGFLGVKPGITPEAKKCLITLVEINGKEILVIVLGSDDRKGDTESLLEYAKRIFSQSAS